MTTRAWKIKLNRPGTTKPAGMFKFIFQTAQKHRHYWEQYQAALFMRLSPEAVHDLQTILVAHGRPNTNWWCADCVKSALQYIYQEAPSKPTTEVEVEEDEEEEGESEELEEEEADEEESDEDEEEDESRAEEVTNFPEDGAFYGPKANGEWPLSPFYTPEALGSARYIHTQAVASTTWNVVHELGGRPSVMVVDTAGTVVIGQVSYNSNTSITISFSAPFAGYAYLT